MEATNEVSEGLLDKIRPPRLEDAGLEDCALPPESIKEAFLKAATAVGSRAASIFSASDEEDCINDPWPTTKESSDVLVGIEPGADPPGPCATEKGGGLPEVSGDEVVVGGADADASDTGDKVVGPDVAEGGEEACVDGLEGLEIGEKGNGHKDEKLKKGGDAEEKEKEKEGERPILVETYI